MIHLSMTIDWQNVATETSPSNRCRRLCGLKVPSVSEQAMIPTRLAKAPRPTARHVRSATRSESSSQPSRLTIAAKCQAQPPTPEPYALSTSLQTHRLDLLSSRTWIPSILQRSEDNLTPATVCRASASHLVFSLVGAIAVRISEGNA